MQTKLSSRKSKANRHSTIVQGQKKLTNALTGTESRMTQKGTGGIVRTTGGGGSNAMQEAKQKGTHVDYSSTSTELTNLNFHNRSRSTSPRSQPVVIICCARICIEQIQPRKQFVDHADYTAPTRQHELDHADHTDHTDQE